MRLKLQITGIVQGVGFRPFIFKLAESKGLKGYVLNDTSGVLIEVEGDRENLDAFLSEVENNKPELSKIYSLQHTFLEDAGYDTFQIRESEQEGSKRAAILPDIATCDACLDDITDPKNRRFLYPFTNCTNCGPRYSIINSLPYDRGSTSMRAFEMCDDCGIEYELVTDRRFHAQPNACHVCGPWVSLYDRDGSLVSEKDEALEKAVNLVRKGYILAVKGLGGYHLVCDASSEEAVEKLRVRKHREEKPLAVMFPDLKSIKKETGLNYLEERTITSVERPIVVVSKKPGTGLADQVSPRNSTVGVFLPYTPLHQLLLRKLKKPVVATSANQTDDPIVKDEKDAFTRLSGIADYIVTHNRDIVRRCDDSVVRIAAERQLPVRRSRGFAPLPVFVPFRFNRPVLALGPYMNNTVALGIDDRVYLSQHIGDLDTPLAAEFYEETVHDLMKLFDVRPEIVVADLHPGYFSTKFGEKYYADKLVKVQHHFAHILSCMAENDIDADSQVIGFAFDGTGHGTDGTVWGGEVLIASYKGFERAFHLRPYRLPGGDKAVKEPCRTAYSLLYEAFGDTVQDMNNLPLSDVEKLFYMKMLREHVNSPVTTSMGRLFDAVASIAGVRHKVSYHAQAAIELEQAALRSDDESAYPVAIDKGIMDQVPVIEKIVKDVQSGVTAEVVAKRFHNTVVKMIVTAAEVLRDQRGIKHVALSGGVFQNTLVLEGAFYQLQEKGFIPLVHQLVPSNDGCISLGQAVYSRFL